MFVTGWVAGGVAARERLATGLYAWDDWRRYAEEHDLDVEPIDMPREWPALRDGRLIYLGRQLSAVEQAFWFWHEVGHDRLHPGNPRSWSAPAGWPMRAKQERQASEFAVLFPVWD